MFGKTTSNEPNAEWVEAGKAALEHHLENHQHCGEWCNRRKMSEQELLNDRKATGKFCCCELKDSTVYQALSDVMAPFIAFDNVEEIAHRHDTQINESLNNSISWFAPKNKTFCRSKSLSCRVHLAVGIQLVGYACFLLQSLRLLGITATPGTQRHVAAIGRKKSQHSDPHKTKEHKRKRQEDTRNKVREHIQSAKTKRQKNGFCAPREGFDTCLPALDPNVCPHCHKRGHKTTVSEQCDLHILKTKKRAEEELARRQADIAKRHQETGKQC